MQEVDEAKRARLVRWRRVALMALGLAAILFLIGKFGENYHPAWGWLRAFGEAALVGALADWFAVVALFRHPMGIPFYHTAIVRRNHGRIAEAIGQFFIRHFWHREVLERFLKGRRFGTQIATLLDERRTEWATAAPRHLARWMERLPEDVLVEPVRRFAEGVVRKIDLGPLAARLLDLLLERGVQQELIAVTAPAIAQTVRENREYLERKIREEIPLPDQMPLRIGAFRMPAEVAEEWFKAVKAAIAAYVAERIVDKTEVVLEEVQRDEAHPIREAVDNRLRQLAEDLRHDPQLLERLEQWRDRLLTTEGWQETVQGLAHKIRNWLIQIEDSPLANEMQNLAEVAIGHAADRLRDPDDWGGQLDALMRGRLLDVAEDHRDEIHRVLVDTVKEWPVEKMSDRMEIELGADLQFVRLNGTLVGGLVGLILHAIGLGIAAM